MELTIRSKAAGGKDASAMSHCKVVRLAAPSPRALSAKTRSISPEVSTAVTDRTNGSSPSETRPVPAPKSMTRMSGRSGTDAQTAATTSRANATRAGFASHSAARASNRD